VFVGRSERRCNVTVSGVLGLTVGAATESGKEGDRVREERGEGDGERGIERGGRWRERYREGRE